MLDLSRLTGRLKYLSDGQSIAPFPLYERISEPVKGKTGVFLFREREGIWRTTKDGNHIFLPTDKGGKPTGDIVIGANTISDIKLGDQPDEDGWLEITADKLSKDNELSKEIFDLVQTAYASIGGNLKIKSVNDLAAEAPRIKSLDVDKDNHPDAVVIFKPTFGGKGWKVTAIGHDGEKPSKSAVVKELGKILNKDGYFMEVSSPMSDILISKYGPPAFNEEQTRKVLTGKQIEWLGKHPDGLYPDHNGWYYRVIGGKKSLKILLGKMP
jgi:hypothetical protein